MTKKVSGIIGILIGVVILLIGIITMSSAPEAVDYSNSYQYVRSAEFGADFYTYMYDASYSMVQQLNSMDRGLARIVDAEAKTQESVYSVGGLMMICIGLAVLAMGITAMGEDSSIPMIYTTNATPQSQSAEVRTEQAEAKTVPSTGDPSLSAGTSGQKYNPNHIPAWKRVQMEQENKQ